MTLFHKGGISLYTAKRPFFKPALLFFIIAAYFLAACSAQIAALNWPGLSTDGEKVYLAYGPQVVAYDIATQDRVWAYPAEPNATLQYYAAPSILENRIIIGDYGASGGTFSPGVVVTIYALNGDTTGTPNELWQRNDVAFDHIVASPLQVENTVFVGTADNTVVALDAETGETLWRFTAGHSIWGQPVYKDNVLYVASLDKSLHALNAETGEEIWVARFSGALASQPVVNSNLVYVSSFDGQVHAVDITTGEEQWSAVANDWVWGAPALAGQTLYFADIQGNVFAIDATTGTSQWQVQVAGVVQTSPVVVEDVVYVASADTSNDTGRGILTALAATDGAKLDETMTSAPLYTTPVVAGDLIIVAMQSETELLAAYNLETRQLVWRIAPPIQE